VPAGCASLGLCRRAMAEVADLSASPGNVDGELEGSGEPETFGARHEPPSLAPSSTGAAAEESAAAVSKACVSGLASSSVTSPIIVDAPPSVADVVENTTAGSPCNDVPNSSPNAIAAAPLQPALTSACGRAEVPSRREPSDTLSNLLETTGAWPEALQVSPLQAQTVISASMPTAAVAVSASTPSAAPAAAASPLAKQAASTTAAPATAESANGLRALVAQLSQQLADEVRRRESEEAELETRAAEKNKLLEELEGLRQRRDNAGASAEAALKAAEKTERQHRELAQSHRELRGEVARQEEELQRLNEEARARSGMGRDWARDGPEKDALVETKLQIAEAHDQLAQLKQQLWLNREGLSKQLAELQAENARLRSGRWGVPPVAPRAPSGH